jgi:hypothetical protein
MLLAKFMKQEQERQPNGAHEITVLSGTHQVCLCVWACV